MAQMVIPINKQVDISQGALLSTLGLMNSGDELIQGDSYAHRLSVAVMNGDAQADLTGQAIVGKFIRSDGSTVTVVGSAAGNVASVDFPSFVYAYVGRLIITLSAGGTSLVQLYASVRTGSTNVVVDPGNVLPNLDEIQQVLLDVEEALNRVDAATAAAQAAATEADAAAELANAAAASLEGMTAAANTLAAGSSATAVVSKTGGHYVITFGIPQGPQGVRGTTAYSGTAITGTSATPTAYPTGIAEAIPGDQYFYNGAASADIGNVYRCTAGGDASTALWVFDRNTRGAPGSGAVSTVNGVQPEDGNVTLTGANIPVSAEDGTKLNEALAGMDEAIAAKQPQITADNAEAVRGTLGLKSGALTEVQKGTATVAVTANATASVTVTFPVAFSGTPSVVATLSSPTPADRNVGVYNVTATDTKIYIANGTSYAGNLNVRWVAVV